MIEPIFVVFWYLFSIIDYFLLCRHVSSFQFGNFSFTASISSINEVLKFLCRCQLHGHKRSWVGIIFQNFEEFAVFECDHCRIALSDIGKGLINAEKCIFFTKHNWMVP